MKAPSRKQAAAVVGRSSAGMTLIEVLVTLVIISVGLLGVAALQLTTVRNNYDAYVRSQAAVMASAMLDRMRANRDDAMKNMYHAPDFGTVSGDNNAVRDIREWKQTLVTQLGQDADGRITTQVAADPLTGTRICRVTIDVRFAERGGTPLVFTTTSQI
jgi:type IV pilus assembly protein PilV